MHTFLTNAVRALAVAVLALAPLSAQQSTPPLQAAPSQPTLPGYVIGANDVLRVTVYSGGSSSPDFRLQDYTVQTNGSVTLPLLKPLTLAGLTVTAANAAVRKALIEAGQFEDPSVDIVVMDYHSQNIKVQGAVSRPGNVTIKANLMNISDALVQAGGLTPQAGVNVRVKRASNRAPEPGVRVEDGWEVYTVKQLNEGELTDVLLENGDTIDVPVAPRFYVQGFVNTPGDLQWEPNMTLQRAILKAGGATKDGALNRVSVRRLDPKTKKYEDQDLGKDSMAFIIQPNDVIEVPKKRM